MPQSLFLFAETNFKPMVPLKNSAVMVCHPSHPFHSNSFYTTGLLNTVAYPQSNNRVEFAVKSAKRIISGNTAQGKSLDNDRATRAILQYRNMPIQNIGLFPTQLLLYCWLCDFVPSLLTLYKPHTNWIAAAQNCEISLSHRMVSLFLPYMVISLRHNLHCNNYPERITSAPRNLDRRIEDNTTPVCLPYVKVLAKRIQKICSPYDIRMVFTSGSIFWIYLSRVKLPMEFNMIKNCVYSIPCSCGKIYKGEIGCSQKVRLEEHGKAVVCGEIEKSGIVDHIWKEKGKLSALMGWSWNNW